MLDRAAILAVNAHAGQQRKRLGIPYVTHCFDVMKRLASWGVTDESLLAAALLHDTLEDTPLVADDLLPFGQACMSYVKWVTWPHNVGSKRDKFDHLTELFARTIEDVDVLRKVALLKAADRMCNVSDFQLQDGDYACRYALNGWPAFRAVMDTAAIQVLRLNHQAKIDFDRVLGQLVEHFPELLRDGWAAPIGRVRTHLFGS